jgi:hypothetical protein
MWLATFFRFNIKVGSILFEDDNLSPTKIERLEQLDPLLAIYDRYTGVSGLNINLRKSSALCINTPEALVQDFQLRGSLLWTAWDIWG